MRQTKMIEWMENVEKAISRIMADKVYTSAEFKRERDNFHALCKDLERAEVKKWLQQILEILMAERGKEERSEQISKLDAIIKKHEELIPTVLKTQVKVDLYWKCYAYGDELKPHIEFLDGIMLSSTRDIAPSCVENVDELTERQEKSLSQLEQVQGSASTSKTTSEADGFFGAGFLALGAKKLRTSPPADDALRLAGAERRFVGGARCGG